MFFQMEVVILGVLLIFMVGLVTRWLREVTQKILCVECMKSTPIPISVLLFITISIKPKQFKVTKTDLYTSKIRLLRY